MPEPSAGRASGAACHLGDSDAKEERLFPAPGDPEMERKIGGFVRAASESCRRDGKEGLSSFQLSGAEVCQGDENAGFFPGFSGAASPDPEKQKMRLPGLKEDSYC